MQYLCGFAGIVETELIRIENGDMTKINKEPPVIAVRCDAGGFFE